MNGSEARVAIVTGASKGIGEAAARHLAEIGMRVVLAARSRDAIERIAGEIEAAGGAALAVPCDVADANAVRDLVDRTVARFGGVDVLVNNAGLIDPIGRIAEIDAEAWDRVARVNLEGVFHGLRFAIPAMLERGGGIVVNISSGAATGALEGWSHYCATKAAVRSLTKCAHLEYGAQGIRVVGLSPGTVATDMQASIRDSGVNPVSQLDWSVHIPSAWVARAIAWLCGPEGADFAGTDFSLKNDEGRRRVGLPLVGG